MDHDVLRAMESFLSAQERFDRLQRSAYQRTGRDLCDLGYANFHGGPAPEVLRAMRDCLDEMRPFDLQYTPYGGATLTRRLIADRLSRTHGIRFGWRNVVMTPGAMAALNILFRALQTDTSRAEVIVLTPCWLDYPLYLLNLGLRPVLVPLHSKTLRLDLDRIADSLSAATRAIVFSQPANPTGLLYSRQELSDLGDLLRDHSGNRILIISDECHRDMVFPGRQFVSPVELYDNTCIVYSFGKAYQMQGQRIGYIGVSPRMEDAGACSTLLERLCRVTGFCAPTALMQMAVRRLLPIAVDTLPVFRRREILLSALRDGGYDVEPSDGTHFLYPRATTDDDFQFVEMLAQHGVLALPAPVFHHRGHFRLSLTAPDSQINRAAAVFRAGKEQERGVSTAWASISA